MKTDKLGVLLEREFGDVIYQEQNPKRKYNYHHLIRLKLMGSMIFRHCNLPHNITKKQQRNSVQ